MRYMTLILILLMLPFNTYSSDVLEPLQRAQREFDSGVSNINQIIEAIEAGIAVGEGDIKTFMDSYGNDTLTKYEDDIQALMKTLAKEKNNFEKYEIAAVDPMLIISNEVRLADQNATQKSITSWTKNTQIARENKEKMLSIADNSKQLSATFFELQDATSKLVELIAVPLSAVQASTATAASLFAVSEQFKHIASSLSDAHSSATELSNKYKTNEETATLNSEFYNALLPEKKQTFLERSSNKEALNKLLDEQEADTRASVALSEELQTTLNKIKDENLKQTYTQRLTDLEVSRQNAIAAEKKAVNDLKTLEEELSAAATRHKILAGIALALDISNKAVAHNASNSRDQELATLKAKNQELGTKIEAMSNQQNQLKEKINNSKKQINVINTNINSISIEINGLPASQQEGNLIIKQP